ncbi:MAG TPA: hypothetical protein VII95_16875 [Terriglobales bacterium]|jgi:hypothetical protein
MANLAQLDFGTKGAEVRLRALLEDIVEQYRGVRPGYELALAVWFGKSLGNRNQNLLELFTSPEMNQIVGPEHLPLLWKTGSEGPPFADVYATSVDHFSRQLDSSPDALERFIENAEVLYFDKRLLDQRVLRAFNVITEPAGLLKGWYITRDQFGKARTIRNLLSSYEHIRPQIGLVKIQESPDFENCRGLLHVEVSQTWVPLSPEALPVHTFFNDLQDGRAGYFLFQGGSLYRLLRFEVKTAPEYSTRVLEPLRDARYPEVHLRAVPSPEQSAA